MINPIGGFPHTPRKKLGFWSTIKAHADKPAKERLLRALEAFFWRTLCCRPDGGPLYSWWYHHTGNIARFFHRSYCAQCEARRAYRIKP